MLFCLNCRERPWDAKISMIRQPFSISEAASVDGFHRTEVRSIRLRNRVHACTSDISSKCSLAVAVVSAALHTLIAV